MNNNFDVKYSLQRLCMIKNCLKVFTSNFILLILGIVNTFVFPALMSIQDYASYQEYMLYISYTNICHLGIASGMFLNYAGKKYEDTDKSQYKSEIFLIYIVLSVFTIIGLCFAGCSHSVKLLYVALTIFPMCLIASFQALQQAWEQFTSYAIINALPKILFTFLAILYFFAAKNLTSNFVILTYLVLQWIFCLFFINKFFKFTKNSRSYKIFSKENLKTSTDGFLITFGNYINLLFHAIDKQFVNWFYSIFSFSIYSFAMSMQSIMMVFITALANPFYPRLAKSDVTPEMLSELKELLLMFGAYSGCAYFVVSFFIKHFITKYTASVDVVCIFFAVFPAMAVINVLYINLYRIRRLLKKYILTLILMLAISAVLNGIAVYFKSDYIGISLATLISYYIWLIYSQKHFPDIKITTKDYLYLAGFFVIYIASKLLTNEIIGFVAYGIIITVWNYFVYKNSAKIFINKIQKR